MANHAMDLPGAVKGLRATRSVKAISPVAVPLRNMPLRKVSP